MWKIISFRWWIIWLNVICEFLDDLKLMYYLMMWNWCVIWDLWFKDVVYKDVLFEDVLYKDVSYKDVLSKYVLLSSHIKMCIVKSSLGVHAFMVSPI